MRCNDFTQHMHTSKTLACYSNLSYRITRMNIKQKISFFIAAAVMIGGIVFTIAPEVTAQGADEKCPETSIIEVDCNSGDSTQDSGVWQLLVMALNILTAGVGIAAVGGIVWGSVIYASAQGNADQVKKAKEIIKNVVIGIVSYAGMYLIINFLIPGGLFT